MKDYGTCRNISGSSSKVNNVTANDFKDCFFLPSIFLIQYMVIVETEWLHVQSNIQISVMRQSLDPHRVDCRPQVRLAYLLC